MINFDDFIYNKKRIPDDAKEKTKFFKKLEQQFQAEIASSDLAKEYFKKFRADSIDGFITSFANTKASLAQSYEYYDRLYHEAENFELDYQNKAGEILEFILQKKLFNMQLLWRAGKLKIEGIEIAYDFKYWESHITACPFVAPIEEHEVNILKDFLLHSDDCDEILEHSYFEWQDYDDIMEKDENGLTQDMPAWYEYYDMRMGTGSLLILPNHKGAKEEYYMECHGEAYRRDHPPKTDTAPSDHRPYLAAFGESIMQFVNSCEKDEYFIELFKYYDFANTVRNDRLEDEVTMAVETLTNADRTVYIPSHLNWDQAIIKAATTYKATKVAEALDGAYEEYLLRRDLGILGNKTTAEIDANNLRGVVSDHFRKAILNGRKLCGEPEDFNY